MGNVGATDPGNEIVAQALLFVSRRFACLLPALRAAGSGPKPVWGISSLRLPSSLRAGLKILIKK